MPGPGGVDHEFVRQLVALGRLGARLELGAARELLPWGAQAAVRALRTRAAAQVRPDWSWPLWLDQQLDPGAEAFVAPGELPLATNVTLRNWTMVGNAGSRWEAVVDPAGLVAPWPQSWSLDWAIRAGGRWHRPRPGTGRRQRLRADAPVVETALELPDGEVVQTVYAGSAPEELVVVEVQSRAPDAVEVVLGVRPFDVEGMAVVRRIEVDDRLVRVDGRRALILERAPTRVVCSTSTGVDAFGTAAPTDGRPSRPAAIDPAGMAHATLTYELAPGERIRVAAPLAPPAARNGSLSRRPRRRSRRSARLPELAETHDRWRRELDRGMRVRVPDTRLQRAVDANRAYLLLFHDGDEITPGPRTYHRFWFRDAAYMLLALGQWGLHDEVAGVLSSYPRRQRRNGYFASQAAEWDGNGAAIWALAEHVRLTGDSGPLGTLLPAVHRGAEWIARARRRAGGRRGPHAGAGLLPAGVSAEHLGPPGIYYWDAFWSLRGLLDASWLVGRAGDAAAARRFAGEAAGLQDAIAASLAADERRLRTRAIPAGPDRELDAGLIGSLAACWPLGLMDAADARIEATVDRLRRRFVVGDAFFHGIYHAGLGTYLTLHLAQVELRAGDERAWRRLQWMLTTATPTFTWPEAIHPRLGTGCYGDGHHGWAAADFLSCVRSLLVREDGDDGLVLLSILPPEWRGHPIGVTDAATHFGRVGYRLEWRGRRALLEWNCERPGIRLRAPSLSAEWSTTAQSGTAEFARPEGVQR